MKRILVSISLVVVFGLSVLLPLGQPAAALSTGASKAAVCQGIGATGGNCKSNSTGEINGIIKTVVDLFSLIVGIVAVIVLIVNGFKFITSGGESNAVASAKKGIIFAIVGLVVAGLAQFIVRFVLGNLF